MPGYDLAAIAERIAARRPSDHALVVSVDGPSGAGKTRLANRLGRALGEYTVVRMDHVVPGWDGLEESVDLIAPVVTRLRDRHAVRYRVWDWDRGGWGGELDRPSAPNVVVEGCGSGALRLAGLVDFLVWVDAPQALRRERAIARDGESYAGNWRRWADQEDAHFAANRTRERADLVIDGRRPIR